MMVCSMKYGSRPFFQEHIKHCSIPDYELLIFTRKKCPLYYNRHSRLGTARTKREANLGPLLLRCTKFTV